MKISRLKYSMPVLMMLMIQSGNAMPVENYYTAGQIIYSIEHDSELKLLDASLKRDPNSVFVGNPEEFDGDERILARTIIFMKEKGLAYCENFFTGLELLLQEKNKGKKEVSDSAILQYLGAKGINIDKNTFSNMFRDYVVYLNARGENLPMPVNRSVEERIRAEVKEYYTGSRVGKLTEQQAYDLAMYLRGQSGKTITSEMIITALGLPKEVFEHEDLNAFIIFLNKKGENLSVMLEMTEKERIWFEVNEYYRGKVIGDLTPQQAYDLAMYMRGLTSATTIKSDITTTNKVPSIQGKKITYEGLDDFVNHLNTKETMVGKPRLNVIVERTEAEQIMYDIVEYRLNHAIASNPTNENLYKVVEFLRGKDKVMTSDINDVIFTNEELSSFVDQFKGKYGIPRTITVRRTTEENVGEYLKTHNIATLPETTPVEIETAKTKLCEVIKDLNELVKDVPAGEKREVKTSDVSTVQFTNIELGTFVDYMQQVPEKELSDKIKVVMTDAERIQVWVDEYYAKIINNETGEKQKVGDLSVDQAYDLAMYMRNLTNATTITSDSVKTEVASLAGRTLTYESLNDFVTHLNAKEEAAQKGKLNVTVNRTTKENVSEYLKANDIALLPAKTDEEKEAAKTKLCEVITILKDLVKNVPDGQKKEATTDDVKEKVVFTFEELNKFVKHMQEVPEKEVSDKITIVKTDPEKINDAIDAYKPKHDESQTKEILKKIVEYLQAQGSATIDRDDVKAYLKEKGVSNADEIILSEQDLIDLKNCLKTEKKDLNVNIVQAVTERIEKEVHEYYTPPEGSQAQAQKVGNLTEKQAYDLAMYMRKLDGVTPKPIITSDITKTDAVESIKGKTITHKDLDDFVNYLNAKEEPTDEGKLNVTVEMTQDERISKDVNDYCEKEDALPELKGLGEDTLCAIVKYLQDSENERTSAGVNSQFGTEEKPLNLTYDQLIKLVNHMNEDEKLTSKLGLDRTYEEAVTYKISQYGKTIWGLTPAEAYKIVEYLNGLPDNSNVDSDQIEEEVERTTHDHKKIDVKFEELGDFVEYLKDDLKKTINVVRSGDEQIMYDVGEYSPKNEIVSKPSDDDLFKVVKFLQGLGDGAEVKTSDIEEETGVELTNEELVTFVNNFKGKDGVKNIEVRKTTLENVAEYLEKENIATLPETTPAEIETAKTKLCEVITILNGLVEAAEKAAEAGEEVTEVPATTDDVKEKVVFTFDELCDFVDYMQKVTEKEVSDKITIMKTDAEKIDSAIAAYYPTHKTGLPEDETAAKSALTEIAKHLKTLPSNWKTNSSTIMEELKATTPPKIPSTVNLTYEDMNAYIEALNDENFGLNITIVEEELTLRQKIDKLLLPETPKDKLAEVVYDSYRLDSLLDKDGDIVADDVKNTWADAITASFMLALPDEHSSILKQDSTIQPAIAAAAEAETQSRIATTTDGSIPSTLKTDIENYVNALYEAKSDTMNTSLNSILSENNNLSALKTTEKKTEINSGILTDVTADNNAMTNKVNSVYEDLPEIVEAIRRYAVMYEVQDPYLLDKFMSKYEQGRDIHTTIRTDVEDKIIQQLDTDEGKRYLRIYMKYYYQIDVNDGKYPNAINDIIPEIKKSTITDTKLKINEGVNSVLDSNYVSYFVDTAEKASNKDLQGTLRGRILTAFWKTKCTDYDNKVVLLSNEAERMGFVRKKMYTENPIRCLVIPDPQDGSYSDRSCSKILSLIKTDHRPDIVTILNSYYVPLAAKANSTDFTTIVCDNLFNYYKKHSNMQSVDVSDIYIDSLIKYCFDHAWVPSIYIRDEMSAWERYVSSTWTNSNIPASITTDIRTNIQNALKNLGSGKTLKAGLKNHLNVDGTKALVNDENEWPVANGTSEIDKKYNYTASNKDMVNILDYTYDKLIGDVLAIDAKTAYDVLKAKANATNDAAIDELVSSNLRDTMRTAIAGVSTVEGVKTAANTVLTNDIISQKASTDANVKDKYARIYRSVNLGANNTVDLSGVTDEASVKAAFDTTIYNSIKDYIYPDQISGNFNGINNGVTGFVDAVYGSDDDAKTAAIRQVAMNWITAREEEFKAADIAEMLNDIKVTRNPGDRLKYQVEAYLSSHNIASLPNKTNEDKAKLVKAVEYLQKLDENATVKTTDIADVNFTFPELKAFVDYFKGKEGIKDTILAVKTEEQKIDYAVADYMKNHQIEGQTEAVIRGIVAYLKEQGSETVTSDDVKNHLANKGIIANKDALTLDYQNLIDLKKCLRDQDKDLNVNIVQAVGERIYDEVHEYYVPTDPETEAYQVGNLTEKQAYDLAMYFKGLENAIEVSSDDLKKDGKIPAEANVPYASLNAFVKYLNEEKKENIPVTIKMTTDERIYDEIDKYRKQKYPETEDYKKIGNFTDAEAYELVKYLKDLGMAEVTSEGVLSYLKGTNPPKISAEATITFEQLNDFVAFLKSDEVKEISGITVKRTTEENISKHLKDRGIVASLPNKTAAEAALYCAVMDLKNVQAGSRLTTDDIVGVNFTKAELDYFVEDMKEAGEIDDDITVVPSDDERIMDEVKDYPISNVDSNTLFRVANYLKQTGSEKTSAGINGYFGTDLDVDTLDGFVDDFNEKEGTSIEIEKSALESYCRDAETPAKMKDLGEEKLAEIVEYLKKPKNQEIYNQTSYLLKLDEEKSSSEVNKACGTDLTYDDLNGLVTYMNKKVSGLNLSIEKTNKEKLMDDIDDYLTANPSISGLPSDKDKAKAALYKLAVCLQSLGWDVVVRDSQVLEKCGISGEVSLDNKQQKHFANYLANRGWYMCVMIKRSEQSLLEATIRSEINDLISSAKPAAWVNDPSFTSYRLDGYLKFMWPNGKNGVTGNNITKNDITEAHVKGCWSDLVTYNFRALIFHPHDWGVSKKDRDITYEIDAEADKVINSRIPAKNVLIDSIKSYVSALYEAREIDNKFSQIVNDDNHLGALNADETKAEILTRITSNAETMNAKIDSFYAALTPIAQAVREYAVMCIFKDHPIMMTSDWVNTAIDKYIQNNNESILENIKGDIDAKVLSDTESNAKQYLKCRMNLFEPYIELQNLTDSIINDIYDDAKSLNDVDAAISAAQQKYDTLTRSKIRANQIISRIANFEKNVYLKTIIPAKADISAQIRNCLTNIGYGKTIRDALKVEFKNSTLAALVDDSNAYPVANAGNNYADFKISASGNAVDVLNYTYSRIKNSIIETDADATYSTLETQANAVNNSAIDKLVSSDLRDTMRSASANVTTKDAIKTTAYNVLLNNIIAQKSNTSENVKRSYIKVAYGRNFNISGDKLNNVNNENGVKTAFCNAIYTTINPYIFPSGKIANFSAAGTNVVDFINVIDGNNFLALYESTKKLIDNTPVLASSVIEQLRVKLVDYVINLASNGWNE